MGEIILAVVITLGVVLIVSMFFDSNKTNHDWESIKNMTMDNLHVFNMDDMVEILTMTGETMNITQEHFNRDEYIIKLENDAVINKNALEKIHYYKSGFGMLSTRRGNLSGKEIRVLVELKGGVDSTIKTITTHYRNREELTNYSTRYQATVNDDGELQWYGIGY